MPSGTSPLFHTPDDVAAAVTSPELLRTATDQLMHVARTMATTTRGRPLD